MPTATAPPAFTPSSASSKLTELIRAPAPKARTTPTQRSGHRRARPTIAPMTSEEAASAPQPRASSTGAPYYPRRRCPRGSTPSPTARTAPRRSRTSASAGRTSSSRTRRATRSTSASSCGSARRPACCRRSCATAARRSRSASRPAAADACAEPPVGGCASDGEAEGGLGVGLALEGQLLARCVEAGDPRCDPLRDDDLTAGGLPLQARGGFDDVTDRGEVVEGALADVAHERLSDVQADAEL